MRNDLEHLYQAAKDALAAKDYAHASELLQQVIEADSDYKDSARLLARVTRPSSRRKYNDVRLWASIGVLLLIGLGICFLPLLQERTSQIATPPVILPAETHLPGLVPSATAAIPATAPQLPTPTAVPLSWKRISTGQEFERDTVTALIIDPQDSEVLYVGMEHAGIYKSIDGGLSWRPADQRLSNTHITSLSVDPQNPQFLYAGTMGGIFKSEDGGENWSKIGEGTHILIDPADGSHLYTRDSNQIRQSTDRGKSWETVYSAKGDCPGVINSWAIHPTNGRSLLMIGAETCEWRVYQSNDGGHNWTLMPDSQFDSPGPEVYDFEADKLSLGLDGQGNLDIHPNQIAANDAKGEVYYFWDRYLHKFNPATGQIIRLGKPEVVTGKADATVIAISPFDQKTIYVGGEGLSISKDGGLTWTKLNSGLGTAVLTLETGQGNPPYLYLQGECDTSSFPYLMERSDYLSDGHGRNEPGQPLFISKNGGQTWDLVSQTGCYLIKDSDGITFYRIARAIQYCDGCQNPDGYIWKSQDRGQTWKKVIGVHHFWNLTTLVAHPTQSGTLFALHSDPYTSTDDTEQQFISKDYGKNWERVPSPLEFFPCYGETPRFIKEYRPMAIDPQDGNRVFAIENGKLLESHDSCETTSTFATAPNTNMNSIAFDPKNPGTLYAGTDEGAYISFDSGATWNQINDGLLDTTVVYSILVDQDGSVYAATPSGIFKLVSK